MTVGDLLKVLNTIVAKDPALINSLVCYNDPNMDSGEDSTIITTVSVFKHEDTACLLISQDS